MEQATGAGPGTSAVAETAGATVKKVVVAVHGIGDQYSYATIQSVLNQFCGYYHHPATVPLGSFHTGKAAFTVQTPHSREPFGHFAFAEAYWAPIPRRLVDQKYTVEEAKQWARTIVERLRLRRLEESSKAEREEVDFDLINQVLVEMIETIAVLDRLCYLAEKAGVFTFDLRKLLDDYLGDVQIVTEFRTEREEILRTFGEVMDKVHTELPGAEIYVVAHSEGTVVSFLALLEAFRQPRLPEWAGWVRGFMTLGSPIDKHLVLWPELFAEGPPASVPAEPIRWRNYYDYGDPVGFALDEARAWLRSNHWTGVFDFTDAPGHDNGFTRYPFPGKAHVDYWTDDAVFGHFIKNVVREPDPDPPGKDYSEPPPSIWWKQAVSYVVPYLGVAALLLVASYVLFKSVTGAIDPKEAAKLGLGTIAKSVLGLTTLLLGITVVARIPRLTRSFSWRAGALLVGLLGAGVYLWSVRGAPVMGDSAAAGSATVVVAVALVVVVHALSIWKPSWGLKPMILLGAVAVAGIVLYHLRDAKGPLWPVFLATLAFLYLWWLAALLLDLIFVWHVYIRHSRVLQRMNEIIGRPDAAAREAALRLAR